MKINIGTLANVIKHGDTLNDLLRGGNTPQTIEKVMLALKNSEKLGKLLGALDGLEQNLRVLKLSELEPEA